MEQTSSSLKATVQQAASNLTERSRRELCDTLRDLQMSLETPEEVMHKWIWEHNNAAIIRVLIELKLYNLLTDSQEPLSLAHLAKQTSCDPVLLDRLLRHQASCNHIKETAKDTYTANKTTKALASKAIQAGVELSFDTFGPAYQQLPSFLKDTGYKNPQDIKDSPFNRAYDHHGPVFDFFASRPEDIARLALSFQTLRSDSEKFFLHFPIEKESEAWTDRKKPFFVDVGGNTGAQCKALLEQFPNLKGKILLQDLPFVLQQTELPEGIEKMEYDFFTPESVKGAKYYYLRAVLHDWPDSKCEEILRNIATGMGPESHILIDECLVPETKAPFYVTQADLGMMNLCCGQERSKEQWEGLLKKSGLKLEGITTYSPGGWNLSVIDAVKE